MKVEVFFWQRIVTPHMAYLAEATAQTGIAVTYVANQKMSTLRKSMGWKQPKLKYAKLLIAADVNSIKTIVKSASAYSIHICQGLRNNGLVGVAQVFIRELALSQWIIMETIDDSGLTGLFKRILYRILLLKNKNNIKGILAIGWQTNNWISKRGFSKDRIFPFGYYLQDSISKVKKIDKSPSSFRFIFVGQLIHRKRLDLLIRSLALFLSNDFNLIVIGDGPKRKKLEEMANELIPGRVIWLGQVSMDEIPQQIVNSDCLVLPSRFDGWGAVVSEALMVGTPVICSDACGSAGVALASGFGGVFPVDDVNEFNNLIDMKLRKGVVIDNDRQKLKKWAKCLGVKYGAKYLSEIISKEKDQ